jgi:hypothetical protein
MRGPVSTFRKMEKGKEVVKDRCLAVERATARHEVSRLQV